MQIFKKLVFDLTLPKHLNVVFSAQEREMSIDSFEEGKLKSILIEVNSIIHYALHLTNEAIKCDGWAICRIEFYPEDGLTWYDSNSKTGGELEPFGLSELASNSKAHEMIACLEEIVASCFNTITISH